MEVIEKELENIKKDRKRLIGMWAVALVVLLTVLGAFWQDMEIGITGYQTLESVEKIDETPAVKMSSEGSSLRFDEIPDFRVKVGDKIRFEVEANRGSDLIYTDDTNLFDIDEEGVVEFEAEEKDIGWHRVVIIIKNQEGEIYLQDVKILIEE